MTECEKMGKSFLFLVLWSIPSLVSARVEIDLPELEGVTKLSALLAAIGCYGAILCNEHRELVIQCTNNVNGIMKWILRLAFLLLILPIVGNFVGFYFDRNFGAYLLGTWGVLKAAQGLYISGVSEGIKRTKNK